MHLARIPKRSCSFDQTWALPKAAVFGKRGDACWSHSRGGRAPQKQVLDRSLRLILEASAFVYGSK